MFAFAAWDRHERELWLVRDRLGIKPLYFGWTAHGFAFASECRIFPLLPGFTPRIDPEAAMLFLRNCCVPGSHAIYEGVEKLKPGHLIRLPWAAINDRREIVQEPYWSLEAIIRERRFFTGTEHEASIALEQLLKETVGRQMISDAPLGAFLSGGVDSALVVALMQAGSTSAVKTFTIGTDDTQLDETVAARQTARHLGTDHTECRVTMKEIMEIVPRLSSIYDEPFADSSQIPTALVSTIARKHVTVALSGDGGDELFGGYLRYESTATLWEIFRRCPHFLRSALGGIIRSLPETFYDRFVGKAVYGRRINAGARLHRLAGLPASATLADLYHETTYPPHAAAALFLAGTPVSVTSSAVQNFPAGDGLCPQERMMLADTLSFLPDDILTKVDRASMAVSLEVRVPLLDHRVAEFAWSLPPAFRTGSAQGKPLLRTILKRHLPAEFVARPKRGFSLPFSRWIREPGPMRDWAETLLTPHSLGQSGWFDVPGVRTLWESHVSGACDRFDALWPILMLLDWAAGQRLR